MITFIFTCFLTITIFIQPTIPFYIPGVAPQDFQKGENVEVKVNEFQINKSKKKHIYSSFFRQLK